MRVSILTFDLYNLHLSGLEGLGFRLGGLGFKLGGPEFWVWGSGFERLRVWGVGFRVRGM